MSDSDVEALERIEREAWRDLAAAAPPDFAARVGLETHELGEALMLMASRVPVFQFNWLSGAGLDGADADAIPAAVARFRDAGQRKFFVQIPPSPNAGRLEAQARAAGLAPHPIAWTKFERETRDPPRVETKLSIHEVGGDERDLFAATVVAGYGMPPPIGDMAARDRRPPRLELLRLLRRRRAGRRRRAVRRRGRRLARHRRDQAGVSPTRRPIGADRAPPRRRGAARRALRRHRNRRSAARRTGAEPHGTFSPPASAPPMCGRTGRFPREGAADRRGSVGPCSLLSRRRRLTAAASMPQKAAPPDAGSNGVGLGAWTTGPAG